MNVSALTQFQRAVTIRGFAIKYVLSGLERYTVNGVPHPVSAGRYLLASEACRAEVSIDSRETVQGLCIDIGLPLLAAVVQGRTRPEEFGGTEEQAGPFSGEAYPEAVHAARFTSLGPLLRPLAGTWLHDPHALVQAGGEHYYALAERLVEDHRELWPRLQALPAVRSGTRKDLYRRVQRAKALMDADPAAQLPMEALAHEAAMSAYHFFRAFKLVEGVSPHQYRMQRRLDLGHAILAQGHGTVGEVAVLTGFADGAAFSKAFRKRFGLAPVQVLHATRRF